MAMIAKRTTGRMKDNNCETVPSLLLKNSSSAFQIIIRSGTCSNIILRCVMSLSQPQITVVKTRIQNFKKIQILVEKCL